jgi:hypothetical protein
MKRLRPAAVVVLLPLLNFPAHACSTVACVSGGPEFRRSFAVLVKHDGKPLGGVRIEIATYVTNAAKVSFAGETGIDGKAVISNLPPGEYWLAARLLGVQIADQCFHVARRASIGAKRAVRYQWGDLVPAVRRIAGTLVDSQPGTGESRVRDLIHRVNVPVDGAALRLENALTRESFGTVSDSGGNFAFDPVPDGTYVLHVEGGNTGRPFDPEDLAIKVSGTATSDAIALTRRDAAGGSCGGTQLDLLPREPKRTTGRR